MGFPFHVVRLIEHLYEDQQGTVRTRVGDSVVGIGRGVRQGCILSPHLFNIYAEHMREAFDSFESGIKIGGTFVNNHADDTSLICSSREEILILLEAVKEASEKRNIITQHQEDQSHDDR